MWSNTNVILASSSPRRHELLKQIVDDFLCISPNVEETYDQSWKAEEIAEHLAKIKCKSVAENNSDSLVIGCDTVVHIDGEILGKPKDKSDAKRMLGMLSGNIHQVITGVCVAYRGQLYCIHDKTEVEFFSLSDKIIDEYIATGEPYDKAGAYGIQGYGKKLIKKYIGDYYNVMGLPLADTKKLLDNI